MRSRLSLLLKIRIGGLLLAALALWVFAQIAEEILESESFAFDTKILLTVRSWHSPLLDIGMLGITTIGDPLVLLIICLLLGIWLLQRKQQSEATTLAVAAIGASTLR